MKHQRGQLLIEVLLAIALTAIILPALLTGLFSSREGEAQQKQRIQAVALLKEAEVAVRSIKDQSWSAVSSNGVFYPTITSNLWSLAAGNQTINSLTRSITISDVYRDINGAIVTSGGTLDPSTKRALVRISWTQPYNSSVDSTMYLTRFSGNTSALQTTVDDFSTGSPSGTTIDSTSGGEIVLGAGGSGNWCAPELTLATVDLPKSGVANAIAAIEGKVFAGTGENSSGVSYATVDIDQSDPPVGNIEATFDGYKTNDGISGNNNYGYLATDSNSKEIVIIDFNSITGGKYAEAGYFNAPGNGSGLSVQAITNGANTIGFMTSGSSLHTFNLNSHSGSRPLLATVALAGTGNKVIAWQHPTTGVLYAFVATTSTSNQLQIFQSNATGTTLSLIGQADLTGNGAEDIFINDSGTRAYIATGVSATNPELFIVDIETKSGNRPTLGTYDSSGMNPEGVVVVPGNRAIIVGTGGQEYQVVNIAVEGSPSNCGGLEINSGVNGVAAVVETDGDAYSYIITGDASSELKIIEGGPGGEYSDDGTYTSGSFPAFNAGRTVAFNRFIPNFSQPSQTEISFQVAVADAIAGSCNAVTYTYVGPNGTTSPTDVFYNDGPIPFTTIGTYKNPGQCFSYKAFLSTLDQLLSPTLYDVSINFSP